MHTHVQHHPNTMCSSSTIYASSHAPFSHLAPPGHSAFSTRFFDCVHRALDTREMYDEFLKLVDLFTQNMIDCGRLVRESPLFWGEGAELMRQWREILAWDETKERAWEMAESEGIMVGSEASGMLFRRGVLNRPSGAELIVRYGSYRKLPASVGLVSPLPLRSTLIQSWL
jgi:paired amphipathic helix protein Sin3a